MIPVERNPSPRDLRIFALLLPPMFAIVGGIQWTLGLPRVAWVLWIIGGLLAVLMLAVPSARRWLHVGWMFATYPIGWIVSHVLLATVHLLVATPTALVLRALGRDPMHRGFDADAPSYWVTRRPARDARRYFRQS